MDIEWQIALMLLQTAVFSLTWFLLHRYVEACGPLKEASGVTKINSQLYSVASLVLIILVLSPDHETLARQLFHASKFYEYIDIFNVRSSGGTIDLHFGFHHLTTPYVTFLRVVHNSEGWKYFAACNAFHHVLMYAYFGGIQLPRPVLPWTGAMQLVVGIVVEGLIVKRKMARGGELMWPNVVCACILSVYLVLSTRELSLREAKSKTRRDE